MKLTLLFLFCTIHGTIASHAITIHDGITYHHVCQENPAQSIHYVICDPVHVQFQLAAAHGKCRRAQKVTDIAQQHKALVAINGGFFDFGQKNRLHNLVIQLLDCIGYTRYFAFPVYNLKINHQWFSLSPQETGVIAWNYDSAHTVIDTLQTRWLLSINDLLLPIANINKPHVHGPIIYTPAYDTHTPRKSHVTEIIIEDNVVTAIAHTNGHTLIPPHGFVCTLSDKHAHDRDLSSIQIGSAALLNSQHNNTKHVWNDFDFLLGSTPVLIKDGEITATVLQGTSSFYTKRHPRTAVGITSKGAWVLLVVDGRQSHSVGMTLLELATYMKSLGCVNALNLDGGGSSTLVIHNTVMNKPSGREYSIVKGERPVSNCLLVLANDA